MKTFKGTDKDMQCRGYQYTLGKEEVIDGEVKACENGFHSCQYPLDVFRYYSPSQSRYFECEADGDLSEDDYKVATRKVVLKSELSIANLVNASVQFIKEKIDKNLTGTNTGDYSASTVVGINSHAKVTGKESIACALGDNCTAEGTLGNWLVIAEKNCNSEILNIISVQVDGEKVKENTKYKIVKGELVEVE